MKKYREYIKQFIDIMMYYNIVQRFYVTRALHVDKVGVGSSFTPDPPAQSTQ